MDDPLGKMHQRLADFFQAGFDMAPKDADPDTFYRPFYEWQAKLCANDNRGEGSVEGLLAEAEKMMRDLGGRWMRSALERTVRGEYVPGILIDFGDR